MVDFGATGTRWYFEIWSSWA